ncbi:Leucine-rich repeat serine/threonine-protein kinase [Dirofilaria immitis]
MELILTTGKMKLGSWRIAFKIFYCSYLIAIVREILAVCPISRDIPPPICAFLFTDNECSSMFCTVNEDSEEMELDRSWDNQITLAIIRPDCYLDLYDGANITDTHRFLGGEISEDNVYDLSSINT